MNKKNTVHFAIGALGSCASSDIAARKILDRLAERDKEFKVANAIEVIIDALRESKEPGSYYYSWQANIAVAFQDVMREEIIYGADVIDSDLVHRVSNEAAKRFLNQLIRE